MVKPVEPAVAGTAADYTTRGKSASRREETPQPRRGEAQPCPQAGANTPGLWEEALFSPTLLPPRPPLRAPQRNPPLPLLSEHHATSGRPPRTIGPV